MTKERWIQLSEGSNQDGPNLTPDEIEQGWHWCNEFDGLLVGPGWGELNFCHCLDKNHAVYRTKPNIDNDQTGS